MDVVLEHFCELVHLVAEKALAAVGEVLPHFVDCLHVQKHAFSRLDAESLEFTQAQSLFTSVALAPLIVSKLMSLVVDVIVDRVFHAKKLVGFHRHSRNGDSRLWIDN